MVMIEASLLSRTVAIILLGGALLVAWLVVAQPLIDGHSNAAALLNTYRQLGRQYDYVLKRRDENQAMLAGDALEAAVARLFWEGSSAADISGRIHSKLRAVVDRYASALQSIRVGAERRLQGGRITEFPFVVTYAVRPEAFGEVVYEVEATQPSLFIGWIEASRREGVVIVKMEVCGLTWGRV